MIEISEKILRIDLYNTSIDVLRKEEMLSKINSTYKGSMITIESVIKQVKFLKVRKN